MRVIRALALAAHIVGLSIGVALSLMAIQSIVDNYAVDSTRVFQARTATAAALITVTVAFCALLVARGFTLVAPLTLTTSYLLFGFNVAMYSHGMAKGFPPAAPGEMPALYTNATFMMFAGFVIAVVAWLITYWRSRFPI